MENCSRDVRYLLLLIWKSAIQPHVIPTHTPYARNSSINRNPIPLSSYNDGWHMSCQWRQLSQRVSWDNTYSLSKKLIKVRRNDIRHANVPSGGTFQLEMQREVKNVHGNGRECKWTTIARFWMENLQPRNKNLRQSNHASLTSHIKHELKNIRSKWELKKIYCQEQIV